MSSPVSGRGDDQSSEANLRDGAFMCCVHMCVRRARCAPLLDAVPLYPVGCVKTPYQVKQEEIHPIFDAAVRASRMAYEYHIRAAPKLDAARSVKMAQVGRLGNKRDHHYECKSPASRLFRVYSRPHVSPIRKIRTDFTHYSASIGVNVRADYGETVQGLGVQFLDALKPDFEPMPRIK
ncbi:hypothetical protein EVAR_26072_1 [Eumeta japonica]|uniref:Uncharacterized protein n=1 Tax=Eumeta variegata TaxID=151549 RepID=A0A4C1VQQ3_EUMVA|nr:hypothetical protein EVAR_26072_1 [Eumeta japonica]